MEKRIAMIYELQKAFLTVNGDYYGYDEKDSGIRCYKLRGEERKWLLLSLQAKQPTEDELVHWMPAALNINPKREVERVSSMQYER